MNTATRAAGFALGVLAVFGTGYGLGTLVGPVGSPGGSDQEVHPAPGPSRTDHGGAGTDHQRSGAAPEQPGTEVRR
jgi:hypothetical protein